MPNYLWLLIALAMVASPLILPLVSSGVFDRKSLTVTLIASAIVVLLPFTGFGDATTVWSLFLAQTLLGTAYVSVSRMRQRKTPFLHAVMSTFSNGSWFITMLLIAGAYQHAEHSLGGVALTAEFATFFVASVAGFMVGRLTGVQWMQWLEKRYGITIDSVDSRWLRRLDDATVPVLVLAIFACLEFYGIFEIAPMRDVCIVLLLGFVQASIYALNTRLANRNHPGWPTLTGILGGIVFVVHWTYLMGYTKAGGLMPLTLLVPYTIATVAGSNLGALVSMFYEKVLGLNVNAPVKGAKEYADVKWHRYVLYATGGLCAAYIIFGTQILTFFGLSPHAIALPFSLSLAPEYERPLALLFAVGVYVINGATQALLSRAGNRNNVSFHAGMALVTGSVNFFISAFVILNARFLDLIPVVAFSSALGQFWGQKVSIVVERAIGSVMVIPPEPKKA